MIALGRSAFKVQESCDARLRVLSIAVSFALMFAAPRAQQRTSRIYQLFVRRFRKVPRLEDLDEPHLLPLVTIIGRPNVGKSALFNRLVRKRDALVYDTPGDHVTRDYHEGLGQIADLQFRLIDTSGLEPTAPPSSLQGRAAALTSGVVRSSHAVLMLLDARQGLVAADESLLSWLRRHNTAPLLLLANKADTSAGRNNLDGLQADLASLGYGTATPISATSGEGMADLYQLLQPVVDEATEQSKQQWKQHSRSGSSANDKRQYVPLAYRFAADSVLQQQQQQLQAGDPPGSSVGNSSSSSGQYEQHDDAAVVAAAAAAAEKAEVDRLVQQQLEGETDDDAASSSGSTEAAAETLENEDGAAADDDGLEPQGPLRLAILGLPNAGKSTLMNTLLGYERSLTGPEPGLTRDPTFGWLEHAGLQLQLVDTAGWKRPGALTPTQAPTADPQHKKAPAAAARTDEDDQYMTHSSSSSSGSSSDGSKGDVATSKVLADASLAQAKRALSAVHVAVLLLDAPRLLTISQAITRLELQLAGLALSQGKALVVGLNKADAVPGGPAAVDKLRERVAELLEQRFLAAGRLPVLALSALQGDGAQQLLDAVVDSHGKWNKRVSAYKLRASLAKHALRFFGTGGTANLLGRIKWATQLKPRPPTFVLLLRGSSEVDEGGQRFLANMLRQVLDMQGVPLRLYLRYNKKAQQHQQQQRLQRKHKRGRVRR